jgi:hypothetical protein
MSRQIRLSPTIKKMFASVWWRLESLEAYRHNTAQNARDYQVCHQRIAELAERVAVLEHQMKERPRG